MPTHLRCAARSGPSHRAHQPHGASPPARHFGLECRRLPRRRARRRRGSQTRRHGRTARRAAHPRRRRARGRRSARAPGSAALPRPTSGTATPSIAINADQTEWGHGGAGAPQLSAGRRAPNRPVVLGAVHHAARASSRRGSTTEVWVTSEFTRGAIAAAISRRR